MKVELFIHKDRVPYLVEGLGADRVTVSEVNEDNQCIIEFELINSLDVLYAFHAGIKYGSDSMSKTLFK